MTRFFAIPADVADCPLRRLWLSVLHRACLDTRGYVDKPTQRKLRGDQLVKWQARVARLEANRVDALHWMRNECGEIGGFKWVLGVLGIPMSVGRELRETCQRREYVDHNVCP